MKELIERRVVLITGKGGVGRSSVTAALAHVAARAGKRVLVTEIGEDGDDYSALAHLFGRERLPDAPEELHRGVFGARLLSRIGQEQFLAGVLRVGALARAALSSDALRRLLSAAPSFREMGIFFHLLTYLRAKRADGTPVHELIVVDMPATGHTLALTGLPAVLHRLVTRGPIPEALREGEAYLNDPRTGAAYVVTLPETLPVSESLELIEGLEQTKVACGGVIVNRMPEELFTPEERAALAPLLEAHDVFGEEGFHRLAEANRSVARLRAAVKVPLWFVPELPEHGPPLVKHITDALAPEGVPL